MHDSVRIPYERLAHSLELSSAYAAVCDEEPECTNVKDEFSGTLDYIMYHGLSPQCVLEVCRDLCVVHQLRMSTGSV